MTTKIKSRCNFDIPWQGQCRNLTYGEAFCSKHDKQKCAVCAKQATKACAFTGQFTCGTPLCDKCEGTHYWKHHA